MIAHPGPRIKVRIVAPPDPMPDPIFSPAGPAAQASPARAQNPAFVTLQAQLAGILQTGPCTGA